MRKLESNFITVNTAGIVTYGSSSYPIFEIVYKNSVNKKQTALITGGVHGNEPAGVEAILAYVEYLRLQKPEQKYNIRFVPVVNPWGWCHNIRFNGDGYDVNRDFNSFKTQEGRIIKNHFKGHDLDLIIDLHETVSDGNFIYNYSTEYITTAEELIMFLSANNYKIEQEYKDHSYKVKNGILMFPAYAIYFQNWFYRSPLAHYFYIHHNRLAFTFESSVREKWNKRVGAHKTVISFFLTHESAAVFQLFQSVSVIPSSNSR
jgi:hypothetical protein